MSSDLDLYVSQAADLTLRYGAQAELGGGAGVSELELFSHIVDDGPPSPVLPAFITNAYEPFNYVGTIGSAVDSLPDEVGSLDLIQATPTSRGRLDTDGTYRYVAMDAADDEYYSATSVDWTAGYTWFAVVRTETLANYRNYAGLGDSGGLVHGALFSSAGGSITLQRRTPTLGNCPSANGVFDAATTYMVTATTDAEVWVGRTSVATAAANRPASAQVFAVGRGYSILSGGRLNGRLYALYRAPDGLTVGERESMWDYIEASLPGLV